MAVAEKSMAQVIAERAEEKGRQEGRQEGLSEALSLLLAPRFGAIDGAAASRLNLTDSETLARWLAAAATARTLEDALS